MYKVMIDPGHGHGNANGGKNGYKEYAGMWKLSNYLKAALSRCNIQADLTRTETADPSLETRGGKAKGYDLFISEHSNAGGGKGVECFYSVKKSNDKEWANVMAGTVAKTMGTDNRGGKMKSDNGLTDYYGVIRAAAATDAKHVLLIENGFHDNLADEAFLLVDSNLKKIAEAQAAVICNMLGVVYTPEEAEHWAQGSWDYLNKNGVAVNERRFDDRITRGEVFVLLARMKGHKG